MGWKTINGQSYYYRSTRQGDRVVSEYVGRDEDAVLIAQLIELARDKEKTARAVWAHRQQAMEAQDARVDGVLEQVDAITDGLLSKHGFHNHRGQWRKKRQVNEAD